MSRQGIMRWRWVLAAALLLATGLAYSFWPEAVDVDTGAVTCGPMQVGITDDGVTRVRELYVVSAPVTGYLSRIEWDAGDEIVANATVIARMSGVPSTPLDMRSRAELRDALAAARASGRGVAASLELARADLERAEQLASRGFLAKAQLEAARATARSAEADLQRARAEVGRVQAALTEPAAGTLPAGGSIAVRSPQSGVVLRRLTESEGVVAMGTPLVEIGDPQKIEVVIDLLSRDAARVQAGDAVEITRWGGPIPLTGTVRRVEPFGRLKVSALGIEEQRVDVIVDFRPDAASRISALGHGYQVEGTVILWESVRALRVPVGALFRGADGVWSVFVDDHGRARQRAVRIGHINDRFGEVLDGLDVSETVILNPGAMVENGVRIRPR